MLSKEFSRTENRILGALARLDDFFMDPLLQGYSGITPEPSRNALSTSQGTNEDDSQNDPHPEVGLFHGQMAQNCGLEDGHDNIKLVTDIQDAEFEKYRKHAYSNVLGLKILLNTLTLERGKAVHGRKDRINKFTFKFMNFFSTDFQVILNSLIDAQS